MCSNSPSLIVSLRMGFVVLRLGKESHNPSFPFWGGSSQSFLGNLVTPQSRGFSGRLCAPQNTSRPARQQPGSTGLSHWEAPKL